MSVAASGARDDGARRVAAGELVALVLEGKDRGIVEWLDVEFNQQRVDDQALTMVELAKLAAALARASGRGRFTPGWVRMACAMSDDSLQEAPGGP